MFAPILKVKLGLNALNLRIMKKPTKPVGFMKRKYGKTEAIGATKTEQKPLPNKKY
jgi:hypothetical protein